MFQIAKRIFYENQNISRQKSKIPSFSNIRENRPKILTFVKYFFLNLKHTFSYATRRALSNHHEKRKKNSSKILNCGHITYAVNTLKFEYLPLGKPMAANILALLVWQ